MSEYAIKKTGYYVATDDRCDIAFIKPFESEEEAIAAAHSMCEAEVDRLNKNYDGPEDPFELCDEFVHTHNGDIVNVTTAAVFNDDGSYHLVTTYNVIKAEDMED